jgi:hypothetical protein
MAKSKAPAFQPTLVCLPRILPKAKWEKAAKTATEINPVNHPPIERLVRALPGFRPTAAHISVLTTKYWHTGGVKLGVKFLDGESMALKKRILEHMNAWAKTANVQFKLSNTNAKVRIARIDQGEMSGYWSYLGTDILSIPAGEPTMNLEAFSMQTPESEYHRVVRHETGHTMGFPHEHMRRALVELIDEQKAIAFFGQTQGWSPDEVRQQVLTPIEESSLLGTQVDPKSIMCYQIPGQLTKSGKPIVGGMDIDKTDYTFAGKIYPKPK